MNDEVQNNPEERPWDEPHELHPRTDIRVPRKMRPAQSGVYANHAREELLPFLPAATSVLDVGCASGGWGQTLRQHLGRSARLVGIEAVEDQAARARESGFDQVHQGYFPDDMPRDKERFDVITFNDVLEHTIDPWAVLRSAHEFLAPGGAVLASIPSVQFAPVVVKLAAGRWDYVDDGPLDRTHLRFFTLRTMLDLFDTAGFNVTQIHGINEVAQAREQSAPPPLRAMIRLCRPLLGNARFCQFVLVGRATHTSATVAPNFHQRPLWPTLGA